MCRKEVHLPELLQCQRQRTLEGSATRLNLCEAGWVSYFLFHHQHGALNRGEGFDDKFAMFLKDAQKQPPAMSFGEVGESHGIRLCVELGQFRGFSPMPEKDLMKGKL
jgi:hypothetical protein